ncbi:MAG: hypothetical protein A2057_03210 [Ignavibacteria bacterium GWA2_35_9]|nr:MAG: hypothetical protein A2057_03210 [Ignavibacteria bacterium GWA2_35_9]OGU47758.1 MAG: hypothetical protein A2000_15935 [Ignavibacteria bacterium GWB2_36_8]OGU50141.1 MAG: hypothetical protein A2080_14760 [Ignavibacteria bacterium GWC2_36_12]
MKRINTFAALILILSTSKIFSQTPDTSDFFPYKTGNMWEYFFDGGGPDVDTVQTFTTSDSTDADGYIHITQYQRNINPTTWAHTFYYKIDTVNNYVYGSSGLGTDNDLLYKLDAPQGEQWVVYKHEIGGEMARVVRIYEENYFGIPTKVKVYHYYASGDTTDTTGLDRAYNELAGGFGLSFHFGSEGGGDLYLIGAVINGVLYGDTTKIITSIFDTETNIPERIHLYQNYPNPFNPNTTIKFALNVSGNVSITIYDLIGNETKRLFNEQWKSAGEYEVVWDGRLENGNLAASGIYFYRLKTENKIISRKMILLK